MNNVKITNQMIMNRESVPNEIIPTRLAVATNVIFVTEDSTTEEMSILLYNYDPIKWNQLYPYFVSHNAPYDFKSKNYTDLVNEFHQALLEKDFTKEKRLINTKQEFCKTINQEDVVFLAESFIEDEYWIKYSKSQDVWTIYLMEFYQVSELKNTLEKAIFHQSDKTLMPINHNNLEVILKEEKYNDVPIIDNTIDILKNTELLNKLKKNAIKIV